MRCLLLLLAATSAFANDGGSACRQAISAENADRLFAAVRDFHDDDCALEEVKTERDVMRIEWRKAGLSLPLVEIRPVSCGTGTVNGPAFSMTVPAETGQKCPSAIAKMGGLISGDSFGGPVKLDEKQGGSSPRLWLWPVAGALVLAAVAGLLIWRRRKA